MSVTRLPYRLLSVKRMKRRTRIPAFSDRLRVVSVQYPTYCEIAPNGEFRSGGRFSTENLDVLGLDRLPDPKKTPRVVYNRARRRAMCRR